jgi:hypothetical protein
MHLGMAELALQGTHNLGPRLGLNGWVAFYGPNTYIFLTSG